jgi:hypothetical protein
MKHPEWERQYLGRQLQRMTLPEFWERYPGFKRAILPTPVCPPGMLGRYTTALMSGGAGFRETWHQFWAERGALGAVEWWDPAVGFPSILLYDEDKLAELHAIELLYQLDAPQEEPLGHAEFVRQSLGQALQQCLGRKVGEREAMAVVRNELDHMARQGIIGGYSVEVRADYPSDYDMLGAVSRANLSYARIDISVDLQWPRERVGLSIKIPY